MSKLRFLVPDDFDQWKSLIGEGDLQHHQALPHLIKPLEECRRTRKDFLSFLSNPDDFFNGIEDQGKIVAFIHARLNKKSDGWIHRAQVIVKVEEIVVAQSEQRKGYGIILQDALVEWAKEKQADAIELNVYDFNQSAIQFYLKSGYRNLAHTMRLDLKD